MVNCFGKFFRKIWLGVSLIILTGTFQSFGANRYSNNRNHSEITTSVVSKIRAIIAAGSNLGRHKARFIKIGDSITKSDPEPHDQPGSPFLCQFVCPEYTATSKAWDFTRNLDTYKNELTPSILFYLADTMPDGTTSFNRPSNAAAVGMYADWAVSGKPSPLRKEIDAVNPQFAVIMYGANDAGGYGTLYAVLSTYIGNIHNIVDSCIASGVVPILTATCPRVDKMECTLAMGYLVRALAQQYQIPFIDYYRPMMPLPEYGLRSDGVHPNSLDYNKSCWFTKEGLLFGYNMRNLLTMQALSRVHQIATTSIASIDTDPPSLEGNGSESNPFVMNSIPFIDAQSTSLTLPNVTYKLTLTGLTKLRMFATSQENLGISINIFDSKNELVATSTNEPMLDQNLGAGTYNIKLKTTGTNYGAYQFVLINRDDNGAPKDETTARPASFKSIVNGKEFIIKSNSKTIVITTQKPGILSVLDLKGRQAFIEKLYLDNSSTLWTAPSSGMYILKYTCNKNTLSRTVFVQ